MQYRICIDDSGLYVLQRQRLDVDDGYTAASRWEWPDAWHITDPHQIVSILLYKKKNYDLESR